jgi:phosphoglycolate phosphatase-like HAD superfamily hydrolase
MNKKGLIFDFDGVLHPSTEATMKKIIKNATTAVGKKKTPSIELLKRFWGQPISNLAKGLAIYKKWTKANQKKFLETYAQNKEALGINYQQQKKIIQLLHYFKNHGKDLYILTNRQRESLVKISKEIGLNLSLFKKIITGDTVKRDGHFIRKPNPSILCSLVFNDGNKKNEPLDSFVLIGDSINRDFPLAVQTELDFIGITSLLHNEEEWRYYFKKNNLPQKEHLITNILELKKIIE